MKMTYLIEIKIDHEGPWIGKSLQANQFFLALMIKEYCALKTHRLLQNNSFQRTAQAGVVLTSFVNFKLVWCSQPFRTVVSSRIQQDPAVANEQPLGLQTTHHIITLSQIEIDYAGAWNGKRLWSSTGIYFFALMMECCAPKMLSLLKN